MKTTDILIRAGRNLREAKARTILTALAIAVGATTITLAMAAGNGGRQLANDVINSSGDTYSLNVYPAANSTSVVDDDRLPEYGAPVTEEPADDEISTLSQKDIETLQSLDGVDTINPVLNVLVDYVTRGGSRKQYVTPVNTKADRTEIKLRAGSLTDNMLKKGEVSLPEEYLETFGFASADDAIGQTLYLHVSKISDTENSQAKDFAFTVAAVEYQADTTVFYSPSLKISVEDSQIMYAYQQPESQEDQYYALVVLAKPGANISKLQDEINSKNYTSYSLEDEREQLLEVVNVIQWGLIGFGALAIMASVFGVINTQYISVLERTQQIGLMKAVGASRRDIARLFRYEAAWVGMLGGAIGVTIAYLITLSNPLISNFLQLDSGTQLLRMDWLASIGLIVGLMLVAVVSGYFPARKAAKLDPIEALRSE